MNYKKHLLYKGSQFAICDLHLLRFLLGRHDLEYR